ncbi:glycosyltransferase, partial [Actinomadura roseirufa]|uniref:glycosyltransferase n=1 Tax=Actinomadura roseirufa TaxID=2094049 RepID=UPI001A954C97
MNARRKEVPSLLGDTAIRRATTPRRRFLFAVPPLNGHADPTVAVAAELVRRGHAVAWTGDRATLEPQLRPGSRILTAVDRDFAPRIPAAREAWLSLRDAEARRFLWEGFAVPLGHAMMPGVEKALDRFRPDVVIADQLALAAPVAARRRGLPWATSAATSAGFAPGGTPEDEDWIHAQIGGFQRAHGIDDVQDLRFSGDLVLVFSTAALVGDTASYPGHYAFVGPAPGRPGAGFPWERLDGRPAVLVSLGAAGHPAGAAFFAAAAEAVRDLDVQAVLDCPPGTLADPPRNVLLHDGVPLPRLLERLSAVVCHGGHDTVCETLARGVPLVVAPVSGDEPVIARQVEASGAGVAVPFPGAGPDELRAALTTVLADGPHRAAARRARDCFTAAGGAGEAADRLESLA